MNGTVITFLIFVFVILLIVAAGIFLRARGKKRYYTQAKLIRTEKVMGERTDSEGNVHQGIVSMKLIFGLRNGKELRFDINNQYRGHCAEGEWGNLMYEGDKLLSFESKSGKIGTKLYVQKNSSVFNKFQHK